MSVTVAVAHTAEKHRPLERVLALTREALSQLGGMQSFARPGQTTLAAPAAGMAALTLAGIPGLSEAVRRS